MRDDYVFQKTGRRPAPDKPRLRASRRAIRLRTDADPRAHAGVTTGSPADPREAPSAPGWCSSVGSDWAGVSRSLAAGMWPRLRPLPINRRLLPASACKRGAPHRNDDRSPSSSPERIADKTKRVGDRSGYRDTEVETSTSPCMGGRRLLRRHRAPGDRLFASGSSQAWPRAGDPACSRRACRRWPRPIGAPAATVLRCLHRAGRRRTRRSQVHGLEPDRDLTITPTDSIQQRHSFQRESDHRGWCAAGLQVSWSYPFSRRTQTFRKRTGLP